MRCCAVTALDALSNQYKQDGALADPVNFVATHMLKRDGADLEPSSVWVMRCQPLPALLDPRCLHGLGGYSARGR